MMLDNPTRRWPPCPGDSIEPTGVCEFRAGERVAWTGNDGQRYTGIVHEIKWHGAGWLVGAWLDGERRQLTDEGRPRLHHFPIWAINCRIEHAE